jgi:hypothetical protein
MDPNNSWPTVEVLLIMAKPKECQSQQKGDSKLEEMTGDIVCRVTPALIMSAQLIYLHFDIN